jgi:serine/threonine protein kinase
MPGQRIHDEDHVKLIFKQIVDAVDHLHSMQIVHRDLKLENVLIDRATNKTKLIDFGFATKVKAVNHTKLPFNCGTPVYMCPDLAAKRDHLGGPSDVWALGVILFILLTGKLPFFGSFEDDITRKIISGKYKWPELLLDKQGRVVESSPGAKNLVRKLL